MFSKKHLTMARPLGMAAMVAMGLASCATYDDDFARVNSRLDQLDTRVQGAAESADRANSRLDQLEGRVQQIQTTSSANVPRG
jgi:murein lipoprotein